MEIIKKTIKKSSWAELKAAAEAGTLDTLIQSGDLILFTLKSGEKVAVRATHDDNGKLFFVLEDCMQDNHAMNKDLTKKCGWDTSDMREYLNTEVFALLPDDLQAVIVPTTIVQIVDGKRVESVDKLFLLSKTQVFGKGDWSDDEPEDTQLDWFLHEKNRLKKRAGKRICAWWLRSLLSSSSSSFCNVYSSGNSFYNFASASCGVAFGFRI